jgi:DMSO reductase family type II enzyme chaperone
MGEQENIHRARLYSALSAAFDRPDEGFIRAIEDGSFAETVTESAMTLGGDVERAASALETTIPEDATELRSAYAAAFGNENESTVSQYETGYAPGTLVTNTNQLADMAGFYRAFGLDIAPDQRDRADYLSTQIEFVSHLALQRAYLAEAGDESGVEIVTDARASFVEDHLGRWAPRFVAEVLGEVEEPFYRVLADLLGALVESDVEILDIAPAEFEAEPTAPLESLPGMERDEEGRLATSCGAMASPEPQQPGVDR